MRYTAALLILLGTGSIASAQQAGIAGAQMRTNDRMLGDLGGIAAGATWAWSPVFAWRVTYNHLGRDQTRTGVACAGLLPPDPVLCPVETIDDDVAVRGVALGLVTTVARRGSLALSLIPSAGFFGVRSTSEGRQTGNRLSAAESMIGLGLGAELSVFPHPTWPVAVHVGAHAGLMGGLGPDPVDGYSPFDDAPRVARLELGISIGRRRPPAR
jgi:hypothetical protein